jgi:polysaccharide deacetylase 2 family uncharacterized protein YibQ
VPRTPRKRPRRTSRAAPRRQRRRGTLRPLLAVGLLLLGVGAVAYLAWRTRSSHVAAPVVSAAAVVRDVASRHGCSADRVTVEEEAEARPPLWQITVHAPRGFETERFVLDLEAAAHNLGGRLDTRPLTERGGYGLAHLQGTVSGERWRVVVIGDEPPPRERAPAIRPAGARLAIVLDDAGYSLAPLGEIARLPKAVAVAVLPNATHSAEVARGLAAQGRELLVHMPMEPVTSGEVAPGPDAVVVGLPPAEIAARVRRALQVVAGARGLNNHMGSKATADPATMRAVLGVLRGDGLYFLDSRTTPETVGERTALEMGVPTLHRDVFLDVVGEPEAIRRALRQAVARARSEGVAVAIGHVHPITLEVLGAELPAVLDGVTLVPPSALLAAQ